MKKPAFKSIFIITVILTALSFGQLLNVVSPQTVKTTPVIFLSITSLLLAIASIVVVVRYLVTYKPSRLTVTAGVVATFGLLFGTLLCVWYLVKALS